MGLACTDEKPPAPKTSPASPSNAGDAPSISAEFDPKTDAVLLTFAGERGQFVDTSKLEEVPEEARGLVRVAFLSDERKAPSGKIWVTNLESPDAEGRFSLKLLPRDDFELAALGLGRASKVELPEGLEAPKELAATGDVIIYKTEWCGVCKKVQSYLKQKGVPFVARDIEKDRSAASELRAKAAKAGVPTGSVPIIDVRGKLMVGFDRKKLDALLAEK